MIADDVAVNQKLLRLQLEKMGFTTSTANDGKEAFDQAQSHDFDIVLMDCDMPKVDGYEATSMIRAIEGKRGQVPIIAVTAYDRDGDKQKCLESGMNDYITKGSPENYCAVC
ncbi:MAG: response regulator [Candidatus Obscuribacter sp.]|nr:response regulator [Candidatus Obscuribacter sp.]